MNHLRTRTRRLVAAILLVGGVAVGLTLSAVSASAHNSGSTGYAVSFYKKSTLLGSTTVANGSGLDIVWKPATCSNGYGSPPVAFTWSGTATGTTSAPIIGPCGHAPGTATVVGPDDLRCDLRLTYPYWNCYWTYKRAGSGSSATSAKIGNPGGGTIGTVYLYKRTALSGYLFTGSKPTGKISVPAGTDTIKFAPAG
jgi:hypothetical protein